MKEGKGHECSDAEVYQGYQKMEPMEFRKKFGNQEPPPKEKKYNPRGHEPTIAQFEDAI